MNRNNEYPPRDWRDQGYDAPLDDGRYSTEPRQEGAHRGRHPGEWDGGMQGDDGAPWQQQREMRPQYSQSSPQGHGGQQGGGQYRSQRWPQAYGAQQGGPQYSGGDGGRARSRFAADEGRDGSRNFGSDASRGGYGGDRGGQYSHYGTSPQYGDTPPQSGSGYAAGRNAGWGGAGGGDIGDFGMREPRWEPRQGDTWDRPGARQDAQRAQRRGPKGWQRSDERIKEDVSERLYHAQFVDSSEVTVEVSQGKVTLEGTVRDRRSKHAIEDIVDPCPGVKDIDNKLRVDRDGNVEQQAGSVASVGSGSGTSGISQSTASPSNGTSTSQGAGRDSGARR